MYDEAATEAFYDAEDALYRSFWDADGSLHWGLFEDPAAARPADFLAACRRLDRFLLARAGIGPASRVLDLGTGNGTTALWLAAETGCEVVGVDLSGVRVANARLAAAARPGLRATFEKASATALPFPDGHFTHVWSQATLYHVHDREAALDEVARVLAPGGVLAMDDLITPVAAIGAEARAVVYDRLLFEPTYDLAGYAAALAARDLMVWEAHDLGEHLAASYRVLADLARPDHPDLAAAYVRMGPVIARREVGWACLLAEKVPDRLAWVYGDAARPLRQRYDAWSRSYDAELAAPYGACPRAAADALAAAMPTRGLPVLDAGAGTGLVGEALAAHGFTAIAAVDMSPGMLAQAAAKGVYATLHEADLTDLAAPWSAPGAFAGAVSAGVFTFGHAPPAALDLLDRVVAPGGPVVLTFREDYLRATPAIAARVAALGWREVARSGVVIFGDERMVVLTYRTGPGAA